MFLGYLLELIFLLPVVPVVESYDICKIDMGKQICWVRNSSNFVCELSQVPMNGIFQYHYPMTEKLRKYLMDLHNYYRNILASGAALDGKLRNYPAASRMRSLLWDPELEYISWKHAARCSNVHGKCVATKLDPYAGQNLGYKMSPVPVDIADFFNESVFGWWDEKEFMVGPNAFAKKDDGEWGNNEFTQLINDQVSRLGCAVAYCTCLDPKNKYCYHLTCGYSNGNVVGKPIYFPSTEFPGDDCQHWDTTLHKKKWTSLCINTGKKFPEEFTDYNGTLWVDPYFQQGFLR